MKKVLFIVTFLLIILLIIAFVFTTRPTKKQATPTPIPLPSGYDQNYSNMNYLRPGESTIDEVIETNGLPKLRSSFGNTTTLIYATPNSGYENIALFKDGLLEYAAEHVFSSYRGSLSDYLKIYGTPILLYSQGEDGFDWYVFLDKGIAVEGSNNEITRMLYFIPQDKMSFLKNVGQDLGITEKQPDPIEEVLEPNPGL